MLRGKITKCLNEIVGELCAEHDLQPADIKRIAICGNTTMSHIAAGYSPKSLAVAPFEGSAILHGMRAAKGAMAAGIRLMLEETGQQISDIRRVSVAGACGKRKLSECVSEIHGLLKERHLSGGRVGWTT